MKSKGQTKFFKLSVLFLLLLVSLTYELSSVQAQITDSLPNLNYLIDRYVWLTEKTRKYGGDDDTPFLVQYDVLTGEKLSFEASYNPFFYLNIYSVTGNRAYLKLGQQRLDYYVASLTPNNIPSAIDIRTNQLKPYKMAPRLWANFVEKLLLYYHVTGNSTYLEKAVIYANSLESNILHPVTKLPYRQIDYLGNSEPVDDLSVETVLYIGTVMIELAYFTGNKEFENLGIKMMDTVWNARNTTTGLMPKDINPEKLTPTNPVASRINDGAEEMISGYIMTNNAYLIKRLKEMICPFLKYNFVNSTKMSSRFIYMNGSPVQAGNPYIPGASEGEYSFSENAETGRIFLVAGYLTNDTELLSLGRDIYWAIRQNFFVYQNKPPVWELNPDLSILSAYSRSPWLGMYESYAALLYLTSGDPMYLAEVKYIDDLIWAFFITQYGIIDQISVPDGIPQIVESSFWTETMESYVYPQVIAGVGAAGLKGTKIWTIANLYGGVVLNGFYNRTGNSMKLCVEGNSGLITLTPFSGESKITIDAPVEGQKVLITVTIKEVNLARMQVIIISISSNSNSSRFRFVFLVQHRRPS